MVLAGSHRTGMDLDLTAGGPRAVLAGRGDVLLIRPLVAHNSVNARPDTPAHRRILHLEFAASPELPDGYAWHEFVAGM